MTSVTDPDRWITLGNGADSQIRTNQSKSYQADRNATKGTNMTLDRNAEKQEVPINPETGKPYINTLAAVAISPAGASLKSPRTCAGGRRDPSIRIAE